MSGQNGPTDFPQVAVDNDAMSVTNIDVGMPIEVVLDVGQRSRKENVVAVKVGHDIAIDICEAEVGRL